jgi:ATP-dependent Clp protease ATP-binding subunit ClpC
VVGLTRRGTLGAIAPTELAMPSRLFSIRHARGDLLYRLHDGRSSPPLEPVTVVLDTTPPTFGPIEAVLRLVAHLLAVSLLDSGQESALVTLGEPGRLRTLARPADLVALWTDRTLRTPDLAQAIHTAQERRSNIVVLTTSHLAREHPVVASSALRVLTMQASGDQPRHTVTHRHHIHLPPNPTPTAVTRAVAALLTSETPQ